MKDFVARGRIVNWFVEQVRKIESLLLISYYTSETYLRLNGLMNIKNNKNRSQDNPTIINRVTLNDIKFEMWCSLIATEMWCALNATEMWCVLTATEMWCVLTTTEM